MHNKLNPLGLGKRTELGGSRSALPAKKLVAFHRTALVERHRMCGMCALNNRNMLSSLNSRVETRTRAEKKKIIGSEPACLIVQP